MCLKLPCLKQMNHSTKQQNIEFFEIVSIMYRCSQKTSSTNGINNHSHWAVGVLYRATPTVTRKISPGTLKIHTCCHAFGGGPFTTCFYRVRYVVSRSQPPYYGSVMEPHEHFTIFFKFAQFFLQKARATNGKYGPVDLSKNENDWEGLKVWLFSKWIPADFMSVIMTSFSNRFLYYDVINSVFITEIRFLCWNK